MGNHLNVRDTLVFVTGILHYFGNNNSNRRISCSRVGIWIGNGNIIFYIILEIIILTVVYVAVALELVLVTGILYGFGRD